MGAFGERFAFDQGDDDAAVHKQHVEHAAAQRGEFFLAEDLVFGVEAQHDSGALTFRKQFFRLNRL